MAAWANQPAFNGSSRPILLPSYVWFGVTTEDQKRFDERIPHLKSIGHATLRFLSLEPLLEPINIRAAFQGSGRIGWVIVGCESGPGRRPMPIEWLDHIIAQMPSDVPLFVKQIPVDGRVSGDPAEWAPHLRIREYPQMRMRCFTNT
jgi:protein gp37